MASLTPKQCAVLFPFSFHIKLSESTRATDIVHHKHLTTVAALVEEIEEKGGPKAKIDKEKDKREKVRKVWSGTDKPRTAKGK